MDKPRKKSLLLGLVLLAVAGVAIVISLGYANALLGKLEMWLGSSPVESGILIALLLAMVIGGPFFIRRITGTRVELPPSSPPPLSKKEEEKILSKMTPEQRKWIDLADRMMAEMAAEDGKTKPQKNIDRH